MKRSPLPLLMSTLVVASALLNGPAFMQSPSKYAGFIAQAYAEEAAAVKYQCPMHPQIISDKPGTCPICGMDLVPIDAGQTPDTNAKEDAGKKNSDRKILYWYDPMVPAEHFDKPGKSPFMDMELMPKYAEGGEASAKGKPVVSISAENLQKMGVRTEKVTKSSFSSNLRATGVVMPNERARVALFSQVEGRVSDLKFSAEGDQVKKDDLFYTLYSPDLLSLQNDYLAARQSGLDDLAAAAKKRMKLLGIDDKVIADISKSGKAFDAVPFYISADGILTKINIRNGSYLKSGDEIGGVQDLSIVWVEAAVPEKDLPSVKTGDSATVSFDNGKNYDAKVDYIYPTIVAEARVGKVRLVVDNQDMQLRPSSYGTVTFSSNATASQLTVPSESILRDSSGAHVIISLGGGKFQSRSVQTGSVNNGRTEITEGLQEGEEVVISAQFLIDSESSLRESLQKISGDRDEH